MQAEMEQAGKRGAQLIELRLDFLAKAPDFKRLMATKPCPLIATVRRPSDGGRWAGSEEERLMLLRHAIVAGFDFIDIETDIADSLRRYKDVKRIVSYHNMREVPADLEEIHAKMCNQDADIVKVAVAAQTPADNLRVLNLIKKGPKPTVALCMGDIGFPSRVLSARFGSPFTYCAFNRERGVAPGLPSFDDMGKMYRYGELNAETQVYGVIGDPVGHSLSPQIHNPAFKALAMNAVYLPFRVPRGELAPFLQAFEALPVLGYSVTIPHKEGAATMPGPKDEAVTAVAAANTLVRKDGEWAMYNTDAPAALESLEKNLPNGPDGVQLTLDTRSVLILGAGGAARGIVHALAKKVAALTIANRTMEKAAKLAEEVGCKAVDWNARHNVSCDTVINCTSVGMQPNLDESPLHASFLKPGLTVFDTIYTPETTLLIREAKERGCHVITGVDMFIRQAALQFKLFTGKDAPLDVMTSAVRRAISPIALRDEPEPV